MQHPRTNKVKEKTIYPGKTTKLKEVIVINKKDADNNFLLVNLSARKPAGIDITP
jgi:hypothetical protein